MEHLLTPYTAVTHIGRGVALVLAAHPDDEVLGCGGAILRHVDTGDPIHVVILTDGGHREDAGGDPDAYIAQRQQESRDAAALLGYGAPTFWGLPDRGIEYGERLVSRLVTAILSIEADFVYAPSPFELHPDHRTLGMAAAEAVRRCGRACRLVLYEISAPLRPNLLLDISDLVERKRAAIACFASQLERQRYDDHILALNRFRTYTLPKEVIAAEGYLAVTAEELQRDPLEIYVSEFERHRRLGLSFEPAEGPLVTVIIRSIGRWTFLREALDSVALQTYPNIEVLIVKAKGPGHPDLGEWCGRFPLRLVSRDHPLARSAAANVGLDEAKGDYLIFLDDDDGFYPNHISSLVQTLEQHPEARVAYTGVQAMADPTEDPSTHPLVFNNPYDPVRLRAGNYIPINAVLFARDLLRSGCRFDEGLDVYEDWDFWLQLSKFTIFVHCDQISARYRPSGLSGVGLQPDPRRKREGRVQVLDKWRLRWSGSEIHELLALMGQTEAEAATRIAALEHQLREAEGEQERLRSALAEHERRQAEGEAERDTLKREFLEQTESLTREIRLLQDRSTLAQEAYRQSQDYIDGLRQHLAAVEDTMAWRLATALRARRDRFFPHSTRRRTVLDRFQRLLKRLYVHGFRPPRGDSRQNPSASTPASPPATHEGGLYLRATPDDYQQWILQNEPNDEELARQRKLALTLANRPLITILMPSWDPPTDVFADTLRSVLSQTYDNWELCIAGGSHNSAVSQMLTNLPEKDPRIRVIVLENNLGISGNSDEALKLAGGDFVALLDHDDILAPFALYEVTALLNMNPQLDFIYTDKDLLSADGTTRYDPLFKPDWSPEIMLSANYLTHLCVIRRELIEKVGGWRPDTDGAQDWDLFLRILEKTDRVAHIPKVLYHWRAVSTSAASSPQAKPYALRRQLQAVQEHLRRCGIPATASFSSSGFLRVTWPVTGGPLVSIVIPTRDQVDLLRRCLDGLLAKTTYRHFEILLVENGSKDEATFRYYEEIQNEPRVRILRYPKSFNYSAVNNFAAAHASGELLLFLNNDTEVLEADWLEEMVRWAHRREIGVVGAKLLKPDGMIQHAGIIVGLTGFAGHVFAGGPEAQWSLFGSSEWYRNYLAVTGACLMVRREVFEKVGGFSEEFGLCGSDVELCLRVRDRGYRVVYTPFSRLRHHEAKTRGDSIPQADFQLSFRYYERYLRHGDPYFNSNLSYWHTIPRPRSRPEESSLHFAEKLAGSAAESPPDDSPPKHRPDSVATLWGRYSYDAAIIAKSYDFTEADSLASKRLHAAAPTPCPPRTINWFLPGFEYAKYGGIHTILRFAAAFTRTRHVVNRFVLTAVPSPERMTAAIRDSFPELAEVPVIPVISHDDLLRLPEADACVATFWTTAYAVLKFNRTRRKFYFIQDWETLFYPAGATAAQVDETYRFGFYGIVNSKTVKELYERDYGGTAEYFDPCVDSSLFRPAIERQSGDRMRLFFYGRPEHPRNAFELGIESLRKVKQRLGDRVEIVAAGASWHPRDFRAADVLDNLGLLRYEETADLYRSCDLGLLLMFTRHPSYIPLQLMASGCIVVSNWNPATSWLMQDGVNCFLAKPSPSCLAEVMERAITNVAERRTIRANALKIVHDRYSNWDQQIDKIFEFMSGV